MPTEKLNEDTESNDRYKSILQMANDGVVVIQDNRVAMVNPAFSKLLEFDGSDLIGRDFASLLDPATSHLFKEQSEGFDISHETNPSHRIRMLTKTGRTVMAEISLADFAYQGAPAKVGIVRDITQQLKLEAAIEQSESRYRQLFDSSPMAYFTLSPRGVILQVNQAAMKLLGYEEETMIRRNIEAFLPGDPVKSKAGRLVLNEILQGGTVTGVEILLRRADGKPIWVSITAGPLDKPGRSSRIGLMALDIDRRKAAENRERMEEERANLYLEVATHDLNNINQSILFAMGLLESQMEIPESLQSQLEEATWNVRRSARMIANMRTIITLRDQPPQLEKTDIYNHLVAAVESVRIDFHWKELNINTNITEEEFFIPGHQYLSQVLFNIIHNSTMYDERVNVDVDVSAEIIDSRLVRIEFADHGPGILDPIKEFIFKRSGHPDAQVVGRGLGLTLADNIVRSLNGQIWVEDRVEGDPSKGAKFVCVFPIWTDETDLPCGGKKCITFYKSAHCFWCDPVYDLLMRLMEELSIARSIVESVDVDDPNAELPDNELPLLPTIRLCDIDLNGFVQEQNLRKELIRMLGKPCYKGF
ncbi:MAG: PAS domain S-box protein [Candidatus Thorarchaeota archaeon]